MATPMRDSTASSEASTPVADCDEFDVITLAENRFFEEGYKEGLAEGRKKGYREGATLGAAQGQRVGSEMGFYYGFAVAQKALLREEDKNDKKLRALQQLLELMDKVVLDDASKPELEDDVQMVRSKFKQTCSLLHVTPEFGGGGKNASGSGLSF